MADDVAFQKTLSHAMELWFEPEIKKRQEKGDAPNPFELYAAQALFFADGRSREIRLNEEVQTVKEVKLKAGVSKKAGDPIFEDELEDIRSINLPPSEDANCGHFTLISFKGYWYGAFDFRYNKGEALSLLKVAEEFLITATEALSAGREHAAIDNLFSAAELAAKAFVITTPIPGHKEIKGHRTVHARFNMFARHGNIETDHRKTFNVLSQNRTTARYVGGDLDCKDEEIIKWQSDIAGLIKSIWGRVT